MYSSHMVFFFMVLVMEMFMLMFTAITVMVFSCQNMLNYIHKLVKRTCWSFV